MRVSARFLGVMTIAAAGLVASLSGCQGSPGTAVSPGALPVVLGSKAPDMAAGPARSGVYRAWFDYDGTGLAQVRLSIEAPSSHRQGYVVVYPFPHDDTAPRLKALYYRAPIVLTKYTRANGGVSVAGHAKLGYDLGTFRFEGMLGRTFKVRYRDALAHGTFVARYVNATHPSPFAMRSHEVQPNPSGPWPTPPPLIDVWRVSFAPSNYPVNFMDIQNAEVVLGSGGPGWQVRFNGAESIPPIDSLDPAVNGVWTRNPCTGSVCPADGDWQATVFTASPGVELVFGADDWAPPASDSTDGSWQFSVDSGIVQSRGNSLLVEVCTYCTSE